MANIVDAEVISPNGYFDGTLHKKGDAVKVDLDALGIKSLDGSTSLAPAEKSSKAKASKPAPTQDNPLRGAGQGDDFNPDAIIEGTIEQVTPRLSALTDADLDRVEAAEKDREDPRKGVLTAIEEVRKSRH